MLKTRLVLASLSLCFTWQVKAAVDFSDAEAKYAKRDESRSLTLAARDAYQAILSSSPLTKEERIRATEGYVRTFIFEGTNYTSMLPESKEPGEGSAKVGEGKETRATIMNACWDKAVENFGKEEKLEAYYYFRASCIAYEAEVASLAGRLILAPKLNNTIDDGLALAGAGNFEGGGLYRVKAAVKGNPAGKPLGLYNPEEALVLIDKALESVATPGSVDGIYFCENYRRKVMILTELKRNADALAIADQALNDFPILLEEGLIPEAIRAETVNCMKTITGLKANL